MNYPNLDERIRINFFSGPQKRKSKSESQKICAHLGSLIYDGYNRSEREIDHRIMCIKCGKRFGNDVDMWDVLQYQQKIQMILYELSFLKYPLTGVATRWGITEQKLSQFKKSVVSQIFRQNSEVIEQKIKALPRGIMLGDETFMGQRGNSNVEIVFINRDFETLSTGPAYKGDLKESILEVFHKIPEGCREKLKILITDGEPSYKSIVKLFGNKVIHVAQLHNKKQLGEIFISKYEKLGPHYLHYEIMTHWKAFYCNKQELTVKWEIKLIKGKIQAKRGRPRTSDSSHIKPTKWRQKLEKYLSDTFQKEGTAKIFVNSQTNKLSMRTGAKTWMIQLLTPVYHNFKGKYITTSLMESKHSQIKRNGAGRKQRDAEYGHQLFTLHAFLVEYGYLPFTNLTGRPLYKFLMKNIKKKKMGYRIPEGNRYLVQTVLSTHE